MKVCSVCVPKCNKYRRGSTVYVSHIVNEGDDGQDSDYQCRSGCEVSLSRIISTSEGVQ